MCSKGMLEFSWKDAMGCVFLKSSMRVYAIYVPYMTCTIRVYIICRVCTYVIDIPVLPHKAVAEVSRIGNV